MANPNNPNDISKLGPRPSDGPLAGLESPSYKYNSFIYPLNLGQPGAGLDHYVIFYVNETSTTQFSTRSLSSGPPKDESTQYRNSRIDTIQGTRDAPIGNQPGQSSTQPTGQQRGNGLYVPIRRVSTAIVLYMPEDISVNYSAEWEDTEMGSTKSVLDAIGGEGSMSEVFKSLGISAGMNATDAMSAVTGLSLKDSLSTRGRLAINPHLEAIFRGIKFREFSFKFKFTPQNEKESENISNIISALKFYSTPEIAVGTAGRFWIYPGEFDIKFISHGVENPFVHKISTCALKNMSVNYTPLGAWAAHREHSWGGSPPVAITIDLTFMELEIMQKARILEGYGFVPPWLLLPVIHPVIEVLHDIFHKTKEVLGAPQIPLYIETWCIIATLFGMWLMTKRMWDSLPILNGDGRHINVPLKPAKVMLFMKRFGNTVLKTLRLK